MNEQDLLKRIMHLEDHLHQVEMKNKTLRKALEKVKNFNWFPVTFENIREMQDIARKALEEKG